MGRSASLLVTALGAVVVFAFILLQGRPVDVADGPTGPVACVSYAPYTAAQSPFDPTLVIPRDQIARDMAVLARLTGCVRTYATGQGLDAVVEIAGRHGLGVYAGAWIGRDDVANQAEIARLIAVANTHPEVLRGVIVGNEVLLRGEQTAAVLAGYIAQVRAGLTAPVPITYADVWEFWLEHPELADAVDVVTVHILPYWEDEPIAAEAAVDHVMAVWRGVVADFGPKPVLIGETGWPSAGRRREGAEPSHVNQAVFLRGFLSATQAAGANYNLIEAFDQPWKRSLEGTVGGAWGLFDAARAAKVSMTGPVVERPDAVTWAAGALLCGLLPLVGGLFRREIQDVASGALVGSIGLLIAGTVVLQMWHAQASSRDGLEWAVNGGWLLVGTMVAIITLRTIAGLPCPLTRWSRHFEPDHLRLLVIAAMTVATLGLLAEPRYRDMPVSMFVGLAILLALVPADRRPREQRVLAAVLAVGALGVLVGEGVHNTHAWAWTATAVLLALPVLWPVLGPRRAG